MRFQHKHKPKGMQSNLLYIITILLSLMVIVQLSSCKNNDMNNNNKAVDLKLVADGFVSPVSVSAPADGSHRLFVVDQIGKIWIIDNSGKKLSTPFLDLSSKMVTLSPGYDERGLLSIAFHPHFSTNGKFYVYYTAPPAPGGPQPGANWDNTSRISEFKVMAGNPNVADMSTERIILEENHPQSNHNGGTIAFGPDGYLYISIGDGGNKDDVGPGHVEDWYKVNAGGNGQDITSNLLGNILRIDVTPSGKSAYRIPADNPFVGQAGKDEIYAFGFRNPYRFSFDRGGAHWLIAGDAGQSLFEEIDMVTRGGNYGWNVKEGRHCFDTDNDLLIRNSCPLADPDGRPLIDPVIELANSDNPAGGVAIAVVGGNVYRGESVPSLKGKYVFGILSGSDEVATGRLLTAVPSAAADWPYEQLSLKSFPDNLGQYVKGFGEDENGELFVTASANIGPAGTTGKVYQIVEVTK